ncbi:hypothetical protein I0P04_001895 [Staphylococcus pseudintermedius]|nr:hypothetical protein [Staphylococcus pseudintermedius]EHT6215629.1 hypothetical protein [Staphylococcus pseudintermedius]MCE5684553.1 hypothetical protein [Staphylococcus pseudintermedius]HDU1417132.1 hypothetical protein [Staphylococcus pseudintermedius]
MAKKKELKIELITDVKDNGELVTEVYKAPDFIPFSKLVNATKKLESLETATEVEAMIAMFEVLVDLYNNQFTLETLMNGLDARDALKVVETNIGALAGGVKQTQADRANLKAVTK